MPDRNRCGVRPEGKEGRKGEGHLTRDPSQRETVWTRKASVTWNPGAQQKGPFCDSVS